MKRRLKGVYAYAREVIEFWSSKNAFQLSGALAFYTLFSLAPLLLILIALGGVFFGEEAVRGEIAGQIEGFVGPSAAQQVEEAVRSARLEESGLLPTIVGVGALLFGATTVFAQMQGALNLMWEVVSRPSRSGIIAFIMTRLLSLGLLLVIGFLLMLSFVVTMGLQTLVRYAGELVPMPGGAATAVDLAFTFGVATLVFAAIFKVLPDVNLRWRDMWRGALATAALFTLGQYLISLYLTAAAPASHFGAAGALVLVLMWVYYSSLILFLGAAFTRISMRRRGIPIRPRSTAVKLRIDVVEEDEEDQPAPQAAGP